MSAVIGHDARAGGLTQNRNNAQSVAMVRKRVSSGRQLAVSTGCAQKDCVNRAATWVAVGAWSEDGVHKCSSR